MSVRSFRIARADRSNERDVLTLLGEHIPDRDAAERHAWLYVQNPHGRAITIVAYDAEDGTPAGITSIFPRRVIVDGEVRLGSIGGDGFVRPRYRRRGLATAMHEACRTAMHEEGIDFMFGPPEPRNLGALIKAGARVVTQVRRFARPWPLQTIARFARRKAPLGGARLEPLENVRSARVADLLAQSSGDARVVPARDARYYAWRFNPPGGSQRAFALVDEGRVMAIAAIEKRGDGAGLVDVVAPMRDFSSAVARIAELTSARRVAMLMSVGCAAARSLWRAGFTPREAKSFQVMAAPSAAGLAALFDPDAWFYVWGDGDLDKVL